ncbi:MAG: hypothetical protein OFPI_31850 [Osedax symbiont Rs2]|nr:MAG: hypothetical protein OFPI_31850 [Osedax symbiont Rs2]
MQRFEFTVFIPPTTGQFFEFCNFIGVYIHYSAAHLISAILAF